MILLLYSLVGAGVTLAAGPPFQGSKPLPAGMKRSWDALTRSGFEHFYNLEYDKAIADFERELEGHPDDPFVVNHLLQAVISRELYRLNLLDTSLYTHNGFLDTKPSAIDPVTRGKIDQLIARSQALCEARLRANPKDADAYYARGVVRGLRSVYGGLIDKSFVPAMRSALGSREDHEKVLQLDPQYVDAKTAVGVHNYIVGSLPFPIKILVGIVGIGGSRKKGMEYLYDAGNAGGESSLDAKVALSLFLRRDGQYKEAREVMHSAAVEYPGNFLFALEEANLFKDGGQGQEAIAAYRSILEAAKRGQYPNPKLQMAWFGLAESLRGQGDYRGAAAAYDAAADEADKKEGQEEILLRATLASGQMHDLQGTRQEAMAAYNAVVARAPASWEADAARKGLKQRYQGK